MSLKVLQTSFLLLLASATFSQTNSYIKDVLDRAKAMAKVSDYKKAIEDCNEILALDSNQLEALTLKSKYQYMKGDIYTSLATANHAIAIKPSSDLLQHRGRLYLDLKDYSKALEDIELALKANPDVTNYQMRATVYMKLGKYNSAMASLDTALIKDPKNLMTFKSYIKLAAELNQEKLLKKIVYKAENVLSLPQNLYVDISDFYEQNGDIEKAIKYLNKQDSIIKRHQYSRFARLELKRGRYDEYLRYNLLNESRNTFRDKSATSNNIGYAYRLNGSYNKALYYYDKALNEFKHNVFAETGKAVIHYYQNDTLSAVTELNNSVDLHQNYSIGYSVRGYIHMLLGKYDLAEKDFKTALEKNSAPLSTRRGEIDFTGDILAYIAFLNICKADYNAALINLNKAIALKKYEPGNLYNARAYVNAKLGNLDSAQLDNKYSLQKNKTPYIPYYNVKRAIDYYRNSKGEKTFLALRYAAPTENVNNFFASTYHTEKGKNTFIKIRIIGPEFFESKNLEILNNNKPLKKELIENEKTMKLDFKIENQPVTEYSFSLKYPSEALHLKFKYLNEESQTLLIKPE